MSVEVKDKKINSLNRLYSFPLVNQTANLALSAYLYVKAFNPLITKGLTVGENLAFSASNTVATTFAPQITAVDNFACNGLDTFEKYLAVVQSFWLVARITKIIDTLFQQFNQFNKYEQEANVSFVKKLFLILELSLLSSISMANQAVDTYLVGGKKDLSVDSDDESDDEDNVKPNVFRELKKLTTKIQRALYSKATVVFQSIQQAAF